MSDSQNTIQKRPPIVAIMGHVDHGKSTLLDYIRKTNITDGEAGGITQHLSAYEVTHQSEEGAPERITFIDTPGHAAFNGMRTRGASVADIAILIISAEDSIKAQTTDSIRIIKENNVPFLVAINKIDKPNANPEKVKNDLMSAGVFLEGNGGDISFVEISAKSGVGVPELLDTILLLSELENLTGNPDAPAEGFVIESHRDEKRGITATLIIKDGTLHKGDFIVAGSTTSTTRIFENFLGESLETASFSTPIRITGFNAIPDSGSLFVACTNKKEAEQTAADCILQIRESINPKTFVGDADKRKVVPVIIKTDVAGTKEAIEEAINSLTNDAVVAKIIKSEVGAINESDVQLAISDPETIILGFSVDIDRGATLINDYDTVRIERFTVIYRLTEWLAEELELRRPKKDIEEISGAMSILKVFSSQKTQHLIGGAITEGTMYKGDKIRIQRKGETVGYGTIDSMQQAKSQVDKVENGEFGMMIISKNTPEERDMVASFKVVHK
jgi:translation initiation factor IF-2